MKCEIALGIAITSLLSTTAYAAPQGTDGAPAAAVSSGTSHGGGKCASGKCGTEKIYSKKKIEHDPSGVLVRARDGKCGLSGKGYKVAETSSDRLAEGICGR